jgi:hypothetical protein
MRQKRQPVAVKPPKHKVLSQNGESLAYVRDQLGHSSIQVTVDIYGHLVPGANRAAVDRLDAAPTRIRGRSGRWW